MHYVMGMVYKTKAYHQSGLENAERSLTWQGFYVSDHEDLWLGYGIYFWERYKDACWWDGGYIRPVILSAELNCENDSFLNLDDHIQKSAFIAYMSAVFEEAEANGLFVRADSDDIIAGGSCNYYKGQFGTKLIKYSFPEKSGRPQFCATDTSVARNIRMVSFSQDGIFKEVQNEFI